MHAVYSVGVTVHCDNMDSKFTLHFLFPYATDSIFPFQHVSQISNIFCSSEENSSFVSESGLSEGKQVFLQFILGIVSWENSVFFIVCNTLTEVCY